MAISHDQNAIKMGCDLTAEYLIDTMTNVNIANHVGLTPLLDAIQPGDDTTSALYSRKADSIEYLVGCFGGLLLTITRSNQERLTSVLSIQTAELHFIER